MILTQRLKSKIDDVDRLEKELAEANKSIWSVS